MRRFHNIVAVFALTLILVTALVAGGLAISLFAVFGSGKSINSKGPQISAKELQSCEVVLIDLERVDVSLSTELALLPNPVERISITLAPEIEFTAGLFSRESVDSKILGFDTCIATLDSDTWTVKHSSLGLPWFTFGDSTEFEMNSTGASISFDVGQASNSTLIISKADQEPPIQQLTFNAELSFPNANAWIIVSAIVSVTLLVLFVVLVVLYIVKSRKRPQV